MTSFAGLGRFLALVAAAVIGGGVAIGAVSLAGGAVDDATVVTETSAAPTSQLGKASSGSMSVNEIYRRAAPGVVQINATTKVDRHTGYGQPLGDGASRRSARASSSTRPATSSRTTTSSRARTRSR